MSAIRRAVHDGHSPRCLHENATGRSSWQLAHRTRVKPASFFIDDEVLAAEGKTDLSEYAVDPTAKLLPDFFV